MSTNKNLSIAMGNNIENKMFIVFILIDSKCSAFKYCSQIVFILILILNWKQDKKNRIKKKYQIKIYSNDNSNTIFTGTYKLNGALLSIKFNFYWQRVT